MGGVDLKTFRQGDLLFILTDLEKFTPFDRVGTDIIVRGLKDHSVTNGIFYVEKGRTSSLKIGLLVAEDGCNIIHGNKNASDHHKLPLSKGIYEVRRQREIWNGGIRVVID